MWRIFLLASLLLAMAFSKAFPLNLQSNVEQQWYNKPTWLWLLSPLSALFWLLSTLRRRRQLQSAYYSNCPLVIVGNISVGGTGKTPVIIALAQTLIAAGLKPVIISRGYGGAAVGVSRVPTDGSPADYGDEPVMIASRVACPVLVSLDRVAAAEAAVQQHGANVILCDDGLQHYKLGRSFELVVLDASRGTGNGWCLPVGPLRELTGRLQSVDWVFVNGSKEYLPQTLKEQLVKTSLSDAQLQPTAWVNVKTGERCKVDAAEGESTTEMFQRGSVNAVAGIGNPERFYRTLQYLNVTFKAHSFPDHHTFRAQDFAELSSEPVIMTEKDAVKCVAFAQDNWWYLAVEFVLPKMMTSAVIEHCKSFKANSAPK